jgi:hypothetical protein
MARKKGNDDLFDVLRARGLRKSVAKTIAEAQNGSKSGGRKAEGLARDALADLRAAGDAIRSRLIDDSGSKRSAAGKKAAATRKRNATKRSTAAKKAAQTRAKSARSRAKSR